MVIKHGKRFGFEFKCSDAPAMTKSMRIALDDLKLERLFVVYPSERRYALDKSAEALPLRELAVLRGVLR